ncbi:hypothetical protein [uncultured Sunxiuqinia sp.]|uniref:hypothetical protein n=1 Tax=Sunxiuqinia rutila TaxID=1397841 RepID=UPI002606037D|nr:hypothetical protein [uncultured Sunxiuqinia sp.]
MNKLIYILAIIFLVGCLPKRNSDNNDNNIGSESVEQTNDNPSKTASIEKNKESETIIKETPCDSTKCDLGIVLSISENRDNLTEPLIASLLATIDRCCSNNVEFGEFSNEMLFVVLEKRPDLFLKAYKDNINNLDTGYINYELQSPIHDLIPLKEIIQKVDSVEFDSVIKQIVIDNLEKGKWW